MVVVDMESQVLQLSQTGTLKVQRTAEERPSHKQIASLLQMVGHKELLTEHPTQLTMDTLSEEECLSRMEQEQVKVRLTE